MCDILQVKQLIFTTAKKEFPYQWKHQTYRELKHIDTPPDEINHHNQPAAMKIWQTKQTKASPFPPSQQQVLIKE